MIRSVFREPMTDMFRLFAMGTDSCLHVIYFDFYLYVIQKEAEENREDSGR